MSIRKTLDILDESSGSKISRVKVPYTHNALSPIISSSAFDYHYGKLYKKYVDEYNEGDNKAFNADGAYFHGLYFSQFNRVHGIKPHGPILDLINRKFDSFIDFKNSFKEVALSRSGSYWTYLNKAGQIKTTPNHTRQPNIVLVVDMWEHSWLPDFHDKGKFVDAIWKIMDWNIINQRL